MQAVNNHSNSMDVKAAVRRPEKVSDVNRSETQSAKKRSYDGVVNDRMLDRLSYRLKKMHDVDVKFSRHKETGETLIKVVDNETDKVIRQIPSEDFIKFSANMDKMVGVLFDEIA